MSERMSALPGAVGGVIADVKEAGLCGMVTLRGDLGGSALKKAVKAVSGVAVPGQREIVVKGDHGAAWMSPDELLLLCPHEAADALVTGLEAALKGTHFMAVNVSDARAVFDVSGPYAREVLGKLMPVDFAAQAFTPGMIRRSRMAQVPAAVWMTGEETFRVVVFRSVARYAFDLLCNAAGEGGEVGLYA
ncbi:sarcosine oxidase subunit gamma [Aquicoccus sp. G2-2]|uniref:sarcosine oxidase subunit gamma n=1 Tax=Aquicoccus sp. G2-2 TaxID=3092120 RepID=UPI002ADFFFCA|nr:sarcosine oxidase subunit gamma family protein [Aquicoccus sp. G2-2]MEA1113539.1 sarcosine oxidase subunit gamma family protein [Aquicoccus sp. G2-2]